MAKEFSEAFYKSNAWRKCRKSYISYRQSIDGGLCEECHENIGYIVHHIIPITEGNINSPDVTLNFDNLKYDCKACHDTEDAHAFIKKQKCMCRFDKNGQPLPPLR